jgi:hypothetical protein
MLNRRTGLFTGEPGKDSEIQSLEKDSEIQSLEKGLGVSGVESMKNPATEWFECKLN